PPTPRAGSARGHARDGIPWNTSWHVKDLRWHSPRESAAGINWEGRFVNGASENACRAQPASACRGPAIHADPFGAFNARTDQNQSIVFVHPQSTRLFHNLCSGRPRNAAIGEAPRRSAGRHFAVAAARRERSRSPQGLGGSNSHFSLTSLAIGCC